MMRNDPKRRFLSVWFCGLVCAALCRAQGPLAPPGAPGATMKSLGVIEPRVAIAVAGTTISQPGSYYLTTNLVATGHGVTIQSDAVTLDLNGFSITGDFGDSDNGIHISGDFGTGYTGISVRNGSIRQFRNGVFAQHVAQSRFEDLMIATNKYGVVLQALLGRCNGNRFADCRFVDNAYYSVYFFAASSAQCNGNIITRCAFADNDSTCIMFLPQTSSQCNGNLISDCSFCNNGGEGIYLGGSGSQCDGNLVVRNTMSGGLSTGIFLNGQNSRCDGNVIDGCTVRKSAGKGIHCYGADGCRIENNGVFETTGATGYGIVTEAPSVSNLVVRNVCAGQAANFSLGAHDTFGPVVSAGGELATSGDAAQPWANFSR